MDERIIKLIGKDNLNKIKSSRNISTFEDSLAQHINAIWEDLTPEEQQQVKEILG